MSAVVEAMYAEQSTDPEFVQGCADAYQEMKDTIFQVCLAFVRKHGGDLEEVLSESSLAFIQAFAYHKAGKGSKDFKVEVKRWVWFEVFDAYRTRSQARAKVKVTITLDEMPERHMDPRGSFSLTDLSDDARLVAELVLCPPPHLEQAWRARGGSDRNLRAIIRQHLAGMGWSPVLINNTFQEIQDALQ